MGCSLCKPRAAYEPASFMMRGAGDGLGGAAALVTDGEASDKVRMAAILQLATALSLMTTDEKVSEANLCDKLIAARASVSSADVLSFWRARRDQAGDYVVCLGSSEQSVQGARIQMNDKLALPCLALRRLSEGDNTPIVADLGDAQVRGRPPPRRPARGRSPPPAPPSLAPPPRHPHSALHPAPRRPCSRWRAGTRPSARSPAPCTCR